MPGSADEDLLALVAQHLVKLGEEKTITEEEQIQEELRRLLTLSERFDLEVYLIHMGYTPNQVLPIPKTRSP